MPQERIQKVLAAAGFGSRRACETLVEEGRVTVNGRTVWELPKLVDPKEDTIRVDRKPIKPEKIVYFMLNKPPGVYCTNDDPDGRKRAIDLIKGVRERLFMVGRLDASSMGLLILTNDGELTQKLTHPSFQTPKTYRAEVKGRPTDADLQKLRKGVWLSEGKTAPAVITVIHRDREKTMLEITLREGRNREIRRMLAKTGHRVRRLSRIRMGKLSTRKLPLGACRPLTAEEVRYLHKLAEGVTTENDMNRDSGRRRSERKRPARRTAATSESRRSRAKNKQAGPEPASKTRSKKQAAKPPTRRPSKKAGDKKQAPAAKKRRILFQED